MHLSDLLKIWQKASCAPLQTNLTWCWQFPIWNPLSLSPPHRILSSSCLSPYHVRLALWIINMFSQPSINTFRCHRYSIYIERLRKKTFKIISLYYNFWSLSQYRLVPALALSLTYQLLRRYLPSFMSTDLSQTPGWQFVRATYGFGCITPNCFHYWR